MRLLGQFYCSFHDKISQVQNRLQRTKIKKYAQKASKKKKVTYSLIYVLYFYTFSAFIKNGLRKLVSMSLRQFTF